MGFKRDFCDSNERIRNRVHFREVYDRLMPSMETLLQFLYDGNFLGFLQAIYVSAFQSADLFYGVLSLFPFVALYIKTNSLLFVSIIWILVGTLFITAMPIVSNFAVLLMAFGLAGLLYKAFSSLRG